MTLNIAIKNYIKSLLVESDVLDVDSMGETTLTAELSKPKNIGYAMSSDEISQITSAIKKRDSKIKSIKYDQTKKEMVLSMSPAGTNFYCVLRKINADQTDPSSFMYVLWYVPFDQREDIDKPGKVERRESSVFSSSFNPAEVLSIAYNFMYNALLMNTD